MRDYTFHLTAGQQLNFNVVGDFIRCISATGDFYIQPDKGSETVFKAQLAYKLDEEFQSITMTSATTQTIVLMIGKGLIFDNRLAGSIDLDGALSIISTGSASWNAGSVAGTGSRVQLVAAETNRRDISMEILTQDATFYPDNVTSSGKTVKAGSQFSLPTQAEIWVNQASGGTVEYIREYNS